MKVILIYGSENDMPFMQPARDYLEGESLDYVEEVLSAHRNLSELIEYLGKLEESGESWAREGGSWPGAGSLTKPFGGGPANLRFS